MKGEKSVFTKLQKPMKNVEESINPINKNTYRLSEQTLDYK